MKIISGWEKEGYYITKDGKVWSPAKGTSNPNGKFLKLHLDHNGYPTVCLKRNRKNFNYSVHRLVAVAFITNPLKLYGVNHKNGIKTDNRVENLEWMTTQDNIIHSWKLGLHKNHLRGSDHCHAKLNERDAKKIKYHLQGINQSVIADRFGISQSLVSLIRLGLAWQHI